MAITSSKDNEAFEEGDTTHLSPREIEVLQLTSHGYSSAEIAKEFGIAPRTIVFHIKNIARKLNVKTKAHAVAQGLRLKLIE